MEKCPECNSLIAAPAIRCEFCNHRFHADQLYEARSSNKRAWFRRERPWFLSKILIVPIGFNGLGALEVFLVLLPTIIWTSRDVPPGESPLQWAILTALTA